MTYNSTITLSNLKANSRIHKWVEPVPVVPCNPKTWETKAVGYHEFETSRGYKVPSGDTEWDLVQGHQSLDKGTLHPI